MTTAPQHPPPSIPSLNGNFLVTSSRAGRSDTLMVRGNIIAWLLERKAKPTKQPGRFKMGGWRVEIQALSEETMAAMHRIFADPK